MGRAFRTPISRVSLILLFVGALGIFQFAIIRPVQADQVYFQLCSGSTPNIFSQNWSNPGLITANDNWSGVGSIEGFRGDDITTLTGVDPQTLLGGDDAAPVLDVNANQTNPNTFNTGGVTEFDLTDDTIALSGSGTADAPYLKLYLNSTGVTGITVAYRLRDLENGVDNAVQQAALHWRSGTSGSFTNVAAAYVADATTGPSIAGADTAVSAALPAGANGLAQLQLRIMTTNAVGNDEWIALDDIVITPVCGGAPVDTAPSVTSSVPTNGATSVDNLTTIAVNFSEAVSDDPNAFSLVCGGSPQTFTGNGGSGSTFTLTPTSPLPYSASCTLTVENTLIHDNDSDDPPDNMAADYVATFTVEAAPIVCGIGNTLISAIQGSGSTAAQLGVRTIQGVVTADYQDLSGAYLDGFYLQEEEADYDANSSTSEGIFVFESSFVAPNVNVGDIVQVTGTVVEYVSNTGALVSSLTQISTLTSVTVCSTGSPLPAAVTLDLPASAATREALENMRVTIPETLMVTENFNLDRFGELELIEGSRAYTFTQENAPSVAGYSAFIANYANRIITLDDGSSAQNPTLVPLPSPRLLANNTVRAGDTITALAGVLDERFGAYRVQPPRNLVTGEIALTFVAANPRPTSAPTFGEPPDVTVASFNVLNFFNGNGTFQNGAAGGFPTSRGAESLIEYTRQINKLVKALAAIHADIFGLIEIENDSGENQALASVVTALNTELGATEYSYIDTGILGTDEIKVAIIYRISAVTPVGSYATLGGHPFDQNTRAPLAQTFRDNGTGAVFTVVVNHLKSKSSVPALGELPGDTDQNDGQGMSNATRTLAAQLLVNWIDTNGYFADPDVLLLGDYNAYYNEDPITTFVNAGFIRLTDMSDYSYTFDGQIGSLDHAMASESLSAHVIDAEDWHINTDEADAHDYNTNFRSAQQISEWYNTDYYRTSDHDPIVIGLDLPNTATQLVFSTQPPASVVQNSPFTVVVELRDPNNFPVADNDVPVTLALGSNPGSSTLGGTLVVNTVNGVATFNNLTLNNLGTGYTLVASSAGLPDATSNLFNVGTINWEITQTDPILVINDPGNFVAEGATVGDRFGFRLLSQPTADVIVTYTTSDPAQLLMASPYSSSWGLVPSYSVTFSLDGRAGTGLWNRTAITALHGVLDALPEGATSANILITTSSADPAFNNLVIPPQQVTIYDAGVVITPNPTSVDEAATSSYSVVLTAPPGFIAAYARDGGLQLETVTVTANSNNPAGLGVSPSALIFTRANWNVPQFVTLNGIIDGNYFVTHGVSSNVTINPYMDTAYGNGGVNVIAPTVNVTVNDTDGNVGNGIPPQIIPPLGGEPLPPEAPAGEQIAPVDGF